MPTMLNQCLSEDILMTNIVPPTQSQLDSLVEPYLTRQQSGLGFAIRCASPSFTPPGNLYFGGSVYNQFGARLGLDGDTLFEIARSPRPLPPRSIRC
jgi:hypothetical protein